MHFPPLHRRRYDAWSCCALVVVLFAVTLRIAAINERTIHIDEGMGLRASTLALHGEWQYYSSNGHGPTLFYLGAVMQAFFGPDIFAARALTVICSTLVLVVLAWFYRRPLSGPGLIVLAALLGSSSAYIFYGAYFIHEMVFMLATTATLIAADAWLSSKNASYIVLFFACAALMYATKETAILTWAAWALAAGTTLSLHPRLRLQIRALPWAAIIGGILIALLIHALLFTSFFSNLRGFLDSLASPFHWFERSQTFHVRPVTYFVELLTLHEMGLVLMTISALGLCIWKRAWSSRLTFFLLWALAMIAAYSIIRYKTPWCIPNLVLPLVLFTSFAIAHVWRRCASIERTIVGCILGIAIVMNLVAALEDSFGNPDRETSHSYAYLQSNESLDQFMTILRGLSYLYPGPGRLPVRIVGNGDELLYVLTSDYARTYGDPMLDLPVYINYQHSAEELDAALRQGKTSYVRVVFTYIQHVNQIDMFINRDLWERYLSSDFAVRPPRMTDGMYDYRTP